MSKGIVKTSLAPWLTVSNGLAALSFYKKAFGAGELYHLDGPDGSIVSRLSVEGA
jgi:PhnB protein